VRDYIRCQLAKNLAGVTLKEFDHETQAFGLATTLGTISMTGITGLTLGGGLGKIRLVLVLRRPLSLGLGHRLAHADLERQRLTRRQQPIVPVLDAAPAAHALRPRLDLPNAR